MSESVTTSLRPIRQDDADALFQAVYADIDPDPHQFLDSGPSPSSPEEMRQQIDNWVDGETAGRGRAFILVDGDDEVVGLALLTRVSEVGEPRLILEPALLVGPRFREAHHATRAMAELERIARADGADELEGRVNVKNEHVIRLLGSCGFEQATDTHPLNCQQTWVKAFRAR